MNELPSSEFRKRFASIKEPTIVTVNGHVIGQWTPFTLGHPHVPGSIVTNVPKVNARFKAADQWPEPEFRPAPKPGR